MKTNTPLRGPKHRGRVFQEYLLSQTPARRAEILAGERAHDELASARHGMRQAAERDFTEILEGPESKGAGDPSGVHVWHLLDRRGTDW